MKDGNAIYPNNQANSQRKGLLNKSRPDNRKDTNDFLKYLNSE
jgi:hypothetical protein